MRVANIERKSSIVVPEFITVSLMIDTNNLNNNNNNFVNKETEQLVKFFN